MKNGNGTDAEVGNADNCRHQINLFVSCTFHMHQVIRCPFQFQRELVGAQKRIPQNAL